MPHLAEGTDSMAANLQRVSLSSLSVLSNKRHTNAIITKTKE